jgi:benzoate/toluate 1,2-dioxygenase beta subunit
MGGSGDGLSGAVVRFLNHEARLLDGDRLSEWLELFAEDGIYWVPGFPHQTDTKLVPSIIHEDRPLLALRVQRLAHPRAYAALPMPRTLHVIGTVDLAGDDAAGSEFRASSNQLVVEYQEGRKRIFAGRCDHVLRRHNDSFRIVLKRFELIDCDDVHEPMTVLL